MGDQLREAAHNGDLAKLADLVELHSSALEDAHPVSIWDTPTRTHAHTRISLGGNSRVSRRARTVYE